MKCKIQFICAECECRYYCSCDDETAHEKVRKLMLVHTEKCHPHIKPSRFGWTISYNSSDVSFPFPFLTKHIACKPIMFMLDLLLGLYFRYPLCCVLQYCIDTSVKGVPCWLYRKNQYGIFKADDRLDGLNGVPCHFHMRKYIAKNKLPYSYRKIKYPKKLIDFIDYDD